MFSCSKATDTLNIVDLRGLAVGYVTRFGGATHTSLGTWELIYVPR